MLDKLIKEISVKDFLETVECLDGTSEISFGLDKETVSEQVKTKEATINEILREGVKENKNFLNATKELGFKLGVDKFHPINLNGRRYPRQVKAFRFVGATIDQLLYTHFHEEYSALNTFFGLAEYYPKLQRPTWQNDTMCSPNLVIRKGDNSNWGNVEKIGNILFRDIIETFNDEFLMKFNFNLNQDDDVDRRLADLFLKVWS